MCGWVIWTLIVRSMLAVSNPFGRECSTASAWTCAVALSLPGSIATTHGKDCFGYTDPAAISEWVGRTVNAAPAGLPVWSGSVITSGVVVVTSHGLSPAA